MKTLSINFFKRGAKMPFHVELIKTNKPNWIARLFVWRIMLNAWFSGMFVKVKYSIDK